MLDLNHPEKGWLHTGRYLSDARAFLQATAFGEEIRILGGTNISDQPTTLHESIRIKAEPAKDSQKSNQ